MDQVQITRILVILNGSVRVFYAPNPNIILPPPYELFGELWSDPDGHADRIRLLLHLATFGGKLPYTFRPRLPSPKPVSLYTRERASLTPSSWVLNTSLGFRYWNFFTVTAQTYTGITKCRNSYRVWYTGTSTAITRSEETNAAGS
jgi:hypothetical protein